MAETMVLDSMGFAYYVESKPDGRLVARRGPQAFYASSWGDLRKILDARVDQIAKHRKPNRPERERTYKKTMPEWAYENTEDDSE